MYKFYFPWIVSVDEVNHRNHVSHQNYFVYFSQARDAYLEQFGCNERDLFGYGLIITEVYCRYKRELSQGDCLRVYCRVAKMTDKMMRMHYEIQKDDILCAEGGTTCLCYDYGQKKVAALPLRLVEQVSAYEGEMRGVPL